MLFQTSPESPYIFAMLRYAFDFAFDSKELFSEAVSECSDEFKASVVEKLSDASAYDQAMIYVASFLANLGNYKSFGDTKFVPACSQEDFKSVILAAATRSKTIDKVKQLFEQVSGPLFALDPARVRSWALDQQTAYLHISHRTVQRAMQKMPEILDEYNISAAIPRLFKTIADNGRVTFLVKLASKASSRDPVEFEGADFVVATGDHAAFMEKAVALLREAGKVAANPTQKQMLIYTPNASKMGIYQSILKAAGFGL